MRDSTFRQPVPPELAPSLATGYVLAGGAPRPFPFEIVPDVPGGAMSATVTDMARFMLALLQEGRYGEQRILEAASVERMWRQLFTHHPRLPGYAWGFEEGTAGGERTFGHGGGLASFQSTLLLLPESEGGFFAVFNALAEKPMETPAAQRLEALFLERYYPAAEHSAPPPTPMIGAARRAERFEGTYWTTRYEHTSPAKLEALNYEVQVSADPDGALRLAQGRARFVEVAPLLFALEEPGPSSQWLAFREDSRGRIMCLAIFLSALVAWPLGVLLRRRGGPGGPRPWLPRVARWAAGLSCALGLLLSLWGLTVLQSFEVRLYGLAPGQQVLLSLLSIGMVLLAPGVVLFTGLAWPGRYWSLAGRVHYTLVSLAALAFIWWLGRWNLLGGMS